MKCEVCGDIDPDIIVLLPKVQPDGKLDTSACESCAISSGMYCQKHERPHIGFEDETTACIPCIEEILEKDGEKIAGSFAAVISGTDKAEEIPTDIQDWIDEVDDALSGFDLADLPAAMRILRTPYAVNIARALICYSERKKITPDEVIQRVAKEGAGVILYPCLTEKE